MSRVKKNNESKILNNAVSERRHIETSYFEPIIEKHIKLSNANKTYKAL